MNTLTAPPTGRKRPVSLTLSEDLVQQARGMTSNLSAVVETLLSGYVQEHAQAQQARQQQATQTAQAWNAFNDAAGAFADEHSTL